MRGDLVLLRPLTGDEDYQLLSEWASSSPGMYSSGRHQFFNAESLKLAADPDGMKFLMVDNIEDGRTVGAVNWRPMAYSGSFTVGNVIGDPELWGLGYGVESVSLLLDHLFHSLNAHRIHLLAGTYNKPMMQIFTNGLFVVEGVLRDYYFLDGEYHDGVVGSLLRDEYYALIGPAGSSRANLIPDVEKRQAKALLRDYLDATPPWWKVEQSDAVTGRSFA